MKTDDSMISEPGEYHILYIIIYYAYIVQYIYLPLYYNIQSIIVIRDGRGELMYIAGNFEDVIFSKVHSYLFARAVASRILYRLFSTVTKNYSKFFLFQAIYFSASLDRSSFYAEAIYYFSSPSRVHSQNKTQYYTVPIYHYNSI